MITRELIPRRSKSPMEVRRRQSRSAIQSRFSFLRLTLKMGRYKPHRWWEHKHPTYRKWEYRNEKD